MNQTQESPSFPNHQFDFADIVLILPLQATGAVMGILYRDQHWYYRIDLASTSDDWWHEEQLVFAASNSDIPGDWTLPTSVEPPPNNPP